MREIPGFTQIKAAHHGKYWYIVDCIEPGSNVFNSVIGGYHLTYGALCVFAHDMYTGDYR